VLSGVVARRPSSQNAQSSAREFVVPEAADGARLSKCLAKFVRNLSPRGAALALEMGAVFVERKRIKNDIPLRAGQHVVVHLGGAFQRAALAEFAGHSEPAQRAESSATRSQPKLQPAPQLLFEDEHLLAVVKPSGLLSAPTPESDQHNLQSLLAAEGRDPLFVVHRLDLETSGILVLAKSVAANRILSECFRVHDLVRRYDAFTANGYPVDEETLRTPVAGKTALSHVVVKTRYQEVSHLTVTLMTGRTHQIRLQLLARGFSVLGDRRYGTKTNVDPPRMALHARNLELTHPILGERLYFEAPLPEDLAIWVSTLR
jgi:23S rRNA pseudouridine1911/1915/1917 synthase